jgi:hypothetical protein
MCDCYEYDFEERVEAKAEEPEKVAVPIQVVRSKKK